MAESVTIYHGSLVVDGRERAVNIPLPGLAHEFDPKVARRAMREMAREALGCEPGAMLATVSLQAPRSGVVLRETAQRGA